MISHGGTVTYAELHGLVERMGASLERHGIRRGHSLAVLGDYSPGTCAMILAALARGLIIVPIASAPEAARAEMLDTAEVMAAASIDAAGDCRVERLRDTPPRHALMAGLLARGAPGLVLFSSGSTGRSKASLLDLDRLTEKLREERPGLCTLVFLMIDHIGGINTLLHSVANGGTIVTASDRSPDAVCSAIAAHRVALLPTTPTFLNMLLISGAAERHDLSSLRMITYGTEPMPPSTLAALHAALPQVRLKQTYGLTEVGILPTQSRDSGSLWVKLGGKGFEHRIVGGVLWLRARSAMLGYLNAPSPFDAEGWFNTQDQVEVDGEYVRILGRTSEIINVGGEKVFPAEVEDVLLRMPNVTDVTVSGRPNPVTGAVVAARFTLATPEDLAALRRRVREFCAGKLERFKVPAMIEIAEAPQHGARFKKLRAAGAVA
ncbi:MAG: fatty acid--CoA ligase family protein [Acetobacteraceae bacterium]|nr:fatty acid--CoA ligase family protein [Acetobacteraceae bacterium]